MDVVLFLGHITLFLWCMSSAMLAAPSEAVPLLAKPNCQSRCGDVEIPYPFGIGEGCYIDDWFQIKCVNSTKPFLNIINLEVLEISVKGTLNVANPITLSSNCNTNKPILQAANLEGSPFVFSQKNIFTAMGCGVMATITSDSNGSTISAGCKPECDNFSTNEKKKGVDFCQTPIPWFLSAFNTSFQVHDSSSSSCNYAFLVDQGWFKWFARNSINNFSAIHHMEHVPVMLEWSLYHSTIDVFGAVVEVNPIVVDSESSFHCRSYGGSSSIYKSSSRLECSCNAGYKGNPYLLRGCQDENECEIGNSCSADTVCKNHVGYYECRSPHSTSWVNVLLIGDGILAVVACYYFYSLVVHVVVHDGSFLELQNLSSGEEDND
ncbi:hypothetical protein CerSpe_119930 [Prunus speciosa]